MANAVVYINATGKTIDFFSINGRDKSSIRTEQIPFAPRAFDPAFYEKLPSVFDKLKKKYPEIATEGVSFLLPECAYANDLITVPIIKGGNVKKTMMATTDALFLNRDEVRIYSETMTQTKQFLTTGYYYVQNEMIQKLRGFGTETKMPIKGILPVGGALVGAVSTLVPKLKSSTYLLLDIKENMARLVFVNRGRALCSTVLPFGFLSLSRQEMPEEDLLFNHRLASDEVIAARRRAKTKQKMFEIAPDEDEESEELPESVENEEGEENILQPDKEVQYLREDVRTINPEELPTEQTKVRRRLPKYMQRPTPETKEGFVYENFRVFMKWALGAIAANDKVTAIGTPEAVYVNLPREFDFLYDTVNREHRENGVRFHALGLAEEYAGFAQNLEFFGTSTHGAVFGTSDSF